MADPEYLTVPHLNRKNLRRIFSKVRLNTTTGCWLWTGSVTTAGYAQTSVNSIKTPVHRIMYAWVVEPIQKGLGRSILQLDHFVCSNRRCINPSHVKLVTAQENTLRSTSMAARYAARTHCKNGHPFPNPEPDKDGTLRRRCKACWKRDDRQLALHRAAQLRYTAKLKAKAHLPDHP